VAEVVLIVVARLSAWWMVPAIGFTFLEKCRLVVSFLGGILFESGLRYTCPGNDFIDYLDIGFGRHDFSYAICRARNFPPCEF
jgi:hypothetical protein